MSHSDKLLNISRNKLSSDSHMFDMHPPDLPSAAALNASIAVDEVVAAVGALKRNKASDLFGMRSEFIIDAVAHLACSVATDSDTMFDTTFLASQSVGRVTMRICYYN